MEEVKDEEQTAGEEQQAEEQEEEEEAEPYDPDRPPFSNFDIAEGTLELLDKKGIHQMTPVQAQSFQLLREGKDMLARSRTWNASARSSRAGPAAARLRCSCWRRRASLRAR